MESGNVSRREFVRQTGVLTAAGLFLSPRTFRSGADVPSKATNGDIRLSTDFVNGGGEVSLVQKSPVVIRVKPHNEGNGGWSQVWWHFSAEGFSPGDEVTLQLDRDEPAAEGVSPQVWFSYDQEVWGLTDTGVADTIEGRAFFIYKHLVRSRKAWFAYDLPYTPQQMEATLLPEARGDQRTEVIELCRTRNDRSVRALRMLPQGKKNDQRYGVWLQARAHAFESGASWVLHELGLWMLSDDPDAKALRAVAEIIIVPIVDVDGVVEGRTGKERRPYDQNRGWTEKDQYWPETRAIQKHLGALAKKNRMDLFIDFHGPAALHHPYFIVPLAEHLPHARQRENRARFFEALGAEPLSEEATRTQSMTKIHFSARPWDGSAHKSSDWVTKFANNHSVAMTLEVNMNTPLSTRDGYQAEAEVLGRAMAKYFTGRRHIR